MAEDSFVSPAPITRQESSGRPDVPEELDWSCTWTGTALRTGARDQQLRRQLDEAGLPPTSFPRVASVLDDLLAGLASTGGQVERVTVEGHSDLLLLLVDDRTQEVSALPGRDAPFLEVLALDHGQFCESRRRCTWATLPCRMR